MTQNLMSLVRIMDRAPSLIAFLVVTLFLLIIQQKKVQFLIVEHCSRDQNNVVSQKTCKPVFNFVFLWFQCLMSLHCVAM